MDADLFGSKKKTSSTAASAGAKSSNDPKTEQKPISPETGASKGVPSYILIIVKLHSYNSLFAFRKEITVRLPYCITH